MSAYTRSVSPTKNRYFALRNTAASRDWAATASPDWGRGLITAASSPSRRVSNRSSRDSRFSPISRAVWSRVERIRFHTWDSSPARVFSPAWVSFSCRAREVS